MGVSAAILTVVQIADAVLGSELAQKLLQYLSKDKGLTAEEIANLQANYDDYQKRMARLRGDA